MEHADCLLHVQPTVPLIKLLAQNHFSIPNYCLGFKAAFTITGLLRIWVGSHKHSVF